MDNRMNKGWAWLFAIAVTLFLLCNGLVYSGWIDFK